MTRQAGQKVQVRLADLVGPRHRRGDRADRLPAVAGGDLANDLRQRHVFPGVLAWAFGKTCHVRRLAANDQGAWWTGQFDLIHGVGTHEAEPPAFPTQRDAQQCAFPGEGNPVVTVIQPDFAFVRMQPGTVCQLQADQPVFEQIGDVLGVGNDLEDGTHRSVPQVDYVGARGGQIRQMDDDA